jgi:hypothetical protein
LQIEGFGVGKNHIAGRVAHHHTVIEGVDHGAKHRVQIVANAHAAGWIDPSGRATSALRGGHVELIVQRARGGDLGRIDQHWPNWFLRPVASSSGDEQLPAKPAG